MSENPVNPDVGTRAHRQFARMKYGKAQGIDRKVLSWRTDGGNRPSDEWFKAEGYFGVLQAMPVNFNPKLEKAILDDPENWTVDHDAGTVTQTYRIETLTGAEQVAAENRFKELVETEGAQRVQRGFEFQGNWFDFPNSIDRIKLAHDATLAIDAKTKNKDKDKDWLKAGVNFKWKTKAKVRIEMDAETVVLFAEYLAVYEMLIADAVEALQQTAGGVPLDYQNDSHWPDPQAFFS